MVEQRKHSGFSIASFVLGVIGITTIWLIFLTFLNPFIFPFSHTPIGIMTIVFGAIGFFRKGSYYGFSIAGFILGVLTGILGLIGFIIRVF